MSNSHVIHRHLHQTPPIAVSGDGCWLVDQQGRRYLDASGGAAVSCLGHGHPAVIAAMHAQIDRLAFAHTGFSPPMWLKSLHRIWYRTRQRASAMFTL